MHKISNRIFEIFFKKTLDFLLAGFRFDLQKENGKRTRFIKMDRDFLYFFIFGIFFQFIFIFKNEGRKKICLESKKNQEKK